MNILKDRQGSMVVWAPVLMVVFLGLFTAISQYSLLNTISSASRDAVQAAITQVCTDNANPVYTGVRDGYSGGYKLENTSWTPDVGSSDILSKIDAKLGTSDGVKTSDGTLIYKITDLSVSMDNAPLAPSDPDGAEQLTGTATYTLTVPLSFGWSALPPMVIHPTVKSGYSQQGDLRGGDDNTDGDPVRGITLSAHDLTLNKGDTQVISAAVVPDNAKNRHFSWTSTDSSVCTVTQTGAVTGINYGTTTIVVISDNGVMASCRVTVVSRVTGVTLDKTQVTMIPGASEQLTATVLPADAANKGVSWESSDPVVCTIDSTGKITAVGAGQATITVMTQESGYYAECLVTVKIPVSGITLDKTALTIAKGANDTLKATVYPSNTTEPGVMWATSNGGVCTVDQSGNIHAVNIGGAIISATTKDGLHVATCTINVVIPVTGVSVSPGALTLIKGTTGAVTAAVSPSDATDKTVFWTSSDSNIASVDSNGTVSANNVGTATITVKTEDGGYTASCSVTVKPGTYTVKAIAGNGGSVSGGGVYQAGSDVTITATPYAHYHFVNWTNSSGNVIGTDKTYTIYNLNADTTIKANFAVDTFTVTVNCSNGGTATGGGIYSYGEIITLTATPNTGYQFLNWSDGALENPRSYTVTQNVNLNATFATNAFMWTFSKAIKDSSWKSKDEFYNGSDFSIRYFVQGRGKRTKDICYVSGTYTFTKPLVLNQGGKIVFYFESGFGNFGNSHNFIYINDSKYFVDWETLHNPSAIVGDHKGTIDISSGATINSITYEYKSQTLSKYRDNGTLKIFIAPANAPAFMLNNSNTSANQSVNLNNIEVPFDEW
ncbi:hypothetical protein A7X67_01510 [Clostridium sp. W14A]|nr:hypothetical protein A7X67_01510 [Clostridium sp. W14A]